MDTRSRSCKPFFAWVTHVGCVILALTMVGNIVLNMMSGVTPASFFRTVAYNWQDIFQPDFEQTQAFRSGTDQTVRALMNAVSEANADWVEHPYWYEAEFVYADGQPVEEDASQDAENQRMNFWQDAEGNWYTADGRFVPIEEMIRIAAGNPSSDYQTPTAYDYAATTAIATTAVTTTALAVEEPSPAPAASQFAKKNVFTLQTMGSAPGTLYYAEDLRNPDFVCTNLTEWGVENFLEAKAHVKELKSEYEYVFIITGGTLQYYQDGIPKNHFEIENLLEYLKSKGAYDYQVVLAGNHQDVYGNTSAAMWSQPLREQESRHNNIRASIIAIGMMLGLIVIMAPVAFLLRRKRRAFYDGLFAILGRVWLEVKVAFALFTAYCTLTVANGVRHTILRSLNYSSVPGNTVLICLCLIGCYVLGVLIWELGKNPQSRRLGLWKLACRLAERVGSLIRRIEALYPFQRVMVLRAAATGAAVVFLSFVMWVVGEASRYSGSFSSFLRYLLILALLAVVLVWFFRGYARMVKGIGQVMDAARDIRAGKLDTTLAFPEHHELRTLGYDLTNIGEGLQTAETERFRAERMKVELVTNISHDLKTPLTSIISYAGLLRDLNLDAPAGEYVNVICQKADRLDRLTRDLFEVSRAQSGNLPLNMERIDFAAHIRQSMAELDERIAASGLDFRVKMPEGPVWIWADGQKLYRVIENLVVNAVKYAMTGTRVWVTLKAGSQVEFEIKNIASYEMTFDSRHITERFVRGDESRTGEGTGLGLAIARSFTESCGGEFRVDVDGDVFRVTMTFARHEALETAQTEE